MLLPPIVATCRFFTDGMLYVLLALIQQPKYSITSTYFLSHFGIQDILVIDADKALDVLLVGDGRFELPTSTV